MKWAKGKVRVRRRGLTLLECTLALVIVPMAVASVALAISAGQQQMYHAMQRTRAAMLAESLMEQVVACEYASIEDFCDDFTEGPNAVRDATGVLYPQPMQAFQRSVTCTSPNHTMHFAGGGNYSQSGLQVTVTVRLKTATLATLTRYFVQPS